jgi:hypothetical protein
MAEQNYAFVVDGMVTNIAVFDDPTEELLKHFKEIYELDKIVLSTERTVIGGTFDGVLFWLPQPFPSWVKGRFDWEAPVSKPDPANGVEYIWSEESTSWIEVPTPS